MLYFSDKISDLHPELLGACLNGTALTQASVKPGLGFTPSTIENHTETQAQCTVTVKNTGFYAYRDLACHPTGKVEQELTILWERSEHHQLDEYMNLNLRHT